MFDTVTIWANSKPEVFLAAVSQEIVARAVTARPYCEEDRNGGPGEFVRERKVALKSEMKIGDVCVETSDVSVVLYRWCHSSPPDAATAVTCVF